MPRRRRIGGTFTDVVAVTRSGRAAAVKVASTPDDYGRGCRAASPTRWPSWTCPPPAWPRSCTASRSPPTPSWKARGGGYGDPLERAPEAVQEDAAQGTVSAAHARDAYGVVLAADGRVDPAATTVLRERRKCDRGPLASEPRVQRATDGDTVPRAACG